MEEFSLGENYVLAANAIKILLPGRIREVCTHDRGQHSPIQTDLARLIRCLLYGETRTIKFV